MYATVLQAGGVEVWFENEGDGIARQDTETGVRTRVCCKRGYQDRY